MGRPVRNAVRPIEVPSGSHVEEAAHAHCAPPPGHDHNKAGERREDPGYSPRQKAQLGPPTKGPARQTEEPETSIIKGPALKAGKARLPRSDPNGSWAGRPLLV